MRESRYTAPGLMHASRFGLLALTLFLILFPLAPGKPGLPPNLKADEPAYYLMARSLAEDRDLRCEPKDLARLFQEYPYLPVRNLILMTDDGWASVYFGKPFVYPLLAAPFAALFGANGLVAVNMALLVAMIWMGAAYLRRFNADAVATLFAAGFFLLSSAYAYVFWLQPEIFNMASVMTCLFLVFKHADAAAEADAPGGQGLLDRAAPLLSGAALSLGVYNKPVLAAFAVPALWILVSSRRLRQAGLWIAGAALTLGLAAGASYLWTGHPSAYLGVERAGFPVEDPSRLPIEPIPIPEGEEPSTANSWYWIFRIPEVDPGAFLRDLGYFLWGRHTGLLPYTPFAALALLLFLVHERRSSVRWLTLGALVAVALFFLIFIPFNWHGGGGFIGNRYFVNVYPAFLFLVTRIGPRWSLHLGYAAGGLLLGPILFTPFGAPVPHPTLQAHVRNLPFRLFPLELPLLSRIPGYQTTGMSGAWFVGRRDVFQPKDDEIWIQGGSPVEIWMRTARPIERAFFRIRTLAPKNRVELDAPGDRAVAEFDAEQDPLKRIRTVVIEPGPASTVLREAGQDTYMYRLQVESESGALPPLPPGKQENFYLGATLAFLGASDPEERDLYALSWGRCRVPGRIEPGSVFTITTRLVNRSREVWPAKGGARVLLAYHWLDADGEPAVWDGHRTPLHRDVRPGERIAVAQEIHAPSEPGRYLLVLDPVFEYVSWFSSRNDNDTYRVEVDVFPAGEGPEVEGDPDAASAGGPEEPGEDEGGREGG